MLIKYLKLGIKIFSSLKKILSLDELVAAIVTNRVFIKLDISYKLLISHSFTCSSTCLLLNNFISGFIVTFVTILVSKVPIFGLEHSNMLFLHVCENDIFCIGSYNDIENSSDIILHNLAPIPFVPIVILSSP